MRALKNPRRSEPVLEARSEVANLIKGHDGPPDMPASSNVPIVSKERLVDDSNQKENSQIHESDISIVDVEP